MLRAGENLHGDIKIARTLLCITYIFGSPQKYNEYCFSDR